MNSIINGFRKYNIDQKSSYTEDVLSFYPESFINSGEHYSSLKKEDILCDFIIKEKLGEGAFGSVRLGINRQTEEKVAIKILEKSKIIKYEDKVRIEREIEILKKIRHPNIVHLYGIIETDKQIFIITEYIKGKELYHYILLKKKLNEEAACFYFKQILSGVEYLHKLKIAHRDIKSENIIIEQSTNLIKIIDFGLSNEYGNKDGELLRSSCGSPLYAPPEMLKGELYKGATVDIWSMGVVLYSMICGSLPFQGEDNSKLFKKIIQGKYTIPMHVSKQARDLLYSMMNINPRKRININQIKRHSWIRLYSNMDKNLGMNNNNYDLGLNLDKYVIPIDEDVIEEMNEKYKLNKIKIRKDILLNKSNENTTLYDLILNKNIRNGKKSIADLKSDLFRKYLKDKKNLLSFYNHNIKKVINDRKNGWFINYEKSEDEISELSKKFVRSQEDLLKINIIKKNTKENDFEFNSTKNNNKYNLTIKSNNNRNKNNLLHLKTNNITEPENESTIYYSHIINNNTPFRKEKNKLKLNNINSVKGNKIYQNVNNNITSSIKRYKMNSVENLFDYHKNFINKNKNKEKKKNTKKFISLDNSKSNVNDINKLSNITNDLVKKDFSSSEYTINDNENNENVNNKVEIINNISSENEIMKSEESKNKIHDIFKTVCSSQKNDLTDNSKLISNYLTTEEKTKNIQTLDSFSLNNYNNEKLIENKKISSKKTNPHEYKQNIMKNKINRINLIKLQSKNIQEIITKNSQKNSINQRISQSERKRNYSKKARTGINLIHKIDNFNEIINNFKFVNNKLNKEKVYNLLHDISPKINKDDNKFIDTAIKIKNDSMYNMQTKKIKVKKYNFIENDKSKQIKNLNLKVFSKIKKEKINHTSKINKQRNNKIFSSVTKLNEISNNSLKKSMGYTSQKRIKINKNNVDLTINRNSITKSNSIYLEEQKLLYTFNHNDKSDILDISNIHMKKMNKNKNLKIIKKTIKKEEINYIPFNLSCAFISSRKSLKQKIINVCDKMKYRIRCKSLYKFNIYFEGRVDNAIEANVDILNNNLGVIQIKKIRIKDLEQINNIKKILFKIK